MLNIVEIYYKNRGLRGFQKLQKSYNACNFCNFAPNRAGDVNLGKLVQNTSQQALKSPRLAHTHLGLRAGSIRCGVAKTRSRQHQPLHRRTPECFKERQITKLPGNAENTVV